MIILYAVIGIIIYLAIGGFVAGFFGDKFDDCERTICCVFWVICVVILLFVLVTEPFIKLGRKLSPFKLEEDEDKEFTEAEDK